MSSVHHATTKKRTFDIRIEVKYIKDKGSNNIVLAPTMSSIWNHAQMHINRWMDERMNEQTKEWREKSTHSKSIPICFFIFFSYFSFHFFVISLNSSFLFIFGSAIFFRLVVRFLCGRKLRNWNEANDREYRERKQKKKNEAARTRSFTKIEKILRDPCLHFYGANNIFKSIFLIDQQCCRLHLFHSFILMSRVCLRMYVCIWLPSTLSFTHYKFYYCKLLCGFSSISSLSLSLSHSTFFLNFAFHGHFFSLQSWPSFAFFPL